MGSACVLIVASPNIQVKYVSTRFEGEDGKILILFIGLASGVGRLVFGRIADIPRVDRILLQQVRVHVHVHVHTSRGASSRAVRARSKSPPPTCEPAFLMI